MKLETFRKLYPDFTGAHDSDYWTTPCANVKYWHVLEDAPTWLFNREYNAWYAGVGNEGGPMGDFIEDDVLDAVIPGLVRRVREAIGRPIPEPSFAYTREQLVRELLAIASDAESEGRNYAPQNAWAIALYQAAQIISGNDHTSEIVNCNAQYRRLEGRSIATDDADGWEAIN